MRTALRYSLSVSNQLFSVVPLLIVLGSPNGSRLRAQSQAADASGPAFEVASIKPNRSSDLPGRIGPEPGGRFAATNATLRALIRTAYNLQDSQIFGGPSWVNSDRFDVLAKADTTVVLRAGGMLRRLLAERFKLAVHNDTRELPIFVLVVADTNGKLGPRLRKSEVDCAAVIKERGASIPPPQAPGKPPLCVSMGGPGRMSSSGRTMPGLAVDLARVVGRTVIDRTGLSGGFDVELEWTPEFQPPVSNGGAAADIPLSNDGSSIFTALREQLGLKLESTRGPVSVLIIDRVEHPTED
jgi:uncharacterized protein (TIGR03435 family)